MTWGPYVPEDGLPKDRLDLSNYSGYFASGKAFFVSGKPRGPDTSRKNQNKNKFFLLKEYTLYKKNNASLFLYFFEFFRILENEQIY